MWMTGGLCGSITLDVEGSKWQAGTLSGREEKVVYHLVVFLRSLRNLDLELKVTTRTNHDSSQSIKGLWTGNHPRTTAL